MKTFVKIKTQFEGIHCWINAPEEVYYLRTPHRHDFYVTCEIEVYHNDRELEFFTILHKLETFISKNIKDLPLTTSCEEYASFIFSFLREEYGDRQMSVEVSEDMKSSSIVKS